MMNKISIVTSLYKSEKYINDFYSQHLDCIKHLAVDYEFVFVDDGSPDNSGKIASQLTQIDKNVKLILLSRNFGQYPAMFAGMANAKGDYIYTADCDLEESPGNIITFYNKISENSNIDFIYGVVKERTGGFIRNFMGRIFFNIMKWMSDIDLHNNMSWQLIMNRKYITALLSYKEIESLPGGLMVLAGFNQHTILIDKEYKGSTSYTFSKRIKLAVNSITAFSSKPLVFIGLFGISVTIIAFLALIAALITKLFYVDYQTGWVSIIMSIWLVGGLILSSVGIVGIYLAKVFNQVKNRPLYIIKSIISQEEK